MDILVKDKAYHVRLVVGYGQFAVHELVTIGSKAAVPFALTGFLLAALHGLHQNVFPLNLRDGGEDGNHQFSAVFGTVDSVLHANQVDAEILHFLQGCQNVRRVASEP